MYRCSVFFVLWLCASAHALAQVPGETLFAVDLSLGADEKATAFDIIRQASRDATLEQSIGLTLFDDTVRAYVAPARLDSVQQDALQNAMANAPPSVRGTSNLAVGIERAIDLFVPRSTANLVVFARGIIDSPNHDPRARFNEWLEQILLPQAAENDIAVTLVIPQNLSADAQIQRAFDTEDTHRIVALKPGARLAPELMAVLNLPDRNYGSGTSVVNNADTRNTIADGAAIQELADNGVQTGATSTSTLSGMDAVSAMRVVLLVLAAALLLAILIWRYRAQRRSPASNHKTQAGTTSSTYRPLSEKPSNTMDNWVEKATGAPLGRTVASSGSQAGTGKPSSNRQSDNDSGEEATAADPWDKL